MEFEFIGKELNKIWIIERGLLLGYEHMQECA